MNNTCNTTRVNIEAYLNKKGQLGRNAQYQKVFTLTIKLLRFINVLGILIFF